MTHLAKQRLIDIDKAKGLAIFLVVFGHIVATDMPANNEWYAASKFIIYKFHMPFFMYLSGIIFAHTYPELNGISDYLRYVKRKTMRLLSGYVTFGIVIFLGKLFFSSFMHVDNLHADFIAEILKLLAIPSQSAAGSLWFIYVLMEIYILFPLLLILRVSTINLVFIGILIHFLPVPQLFMIDRLFEYFLFFSLGMLSLRFYSHYTNILDRFFFLFFTLFIISFLTIPYCAAPISKLIIGIASLPALHGLVRRKIVMSRSIFNIYGKYTYSIYLLNTIFIGLSKGIFLEFTSWDGNNFLFIAPVLLFMGIYAPIFVKIHVFSKTPTLNRLTD